LFRNDWFFKLFGSKENFVNSLPLRHVNGSMPKMLILLADEERFDPPKERTVTEFIAASVRMNVPVTYEILLRRSHMGTVEKMTEPSDPTLQRIITFIRS
nr:hypothetical protein [Bacteroidota bacterium]